MNFEKEILKKILSITLAISLMVNPAMVRLAFAEETSQTQSPDPSPTPTPESTITTGDANAQAEVETTANTNQDTVAGEITTPPGDCTPPEGETTCPEDVVIQNDNSAEVSDSATSSATTGDNQITGSAGDATISTGDATASGTIENEVNSNTVILEETGETVESGETAESEGSGETGEAGETVELAVENNNEGTVINNAEVTADTGENLASENLGDAQIETGDALALANLLTLLNTNIVGSNFEILLLNLLNGQGGEVDLNELWIALQEMAGSDSLVLVGETSDLLILVQNQNQADLENNVDVSAGTGENQANENNNASIGTGDATALANVTNIVNTNILGSQFFFGIINILDSNGDLILPRPERFAPQAYSQNGEGGVIFANQNQAEIEDEVMALAETGNNEETNNQGNNLIETGDAQAVTNTFSLVNLNIFRNNWFFLIINNLGNWTGRIFGWSAPEAVEEPTEGSQAYQIGLGEPSQGGEGVEGEGILPSLSFQNQNQARVRNNIMTSALTGENQANENRGQTSIRTGNARSLANLFNLVNLNILGGRFFMGIVNILGDWSGNTIFAYPDVAVGISGGPERVTPGETITYTLNFLNQGHDAAQGVAVGFELPQGASFLGDSSGLAPSVSGRTYSWLVGTLGVGEGGSFIIQVKVNPDFDFDQSLSWFSKFIPKAHAAENEKESNLTVNSWIVTSDPDSNNDNNSSSVTTVVYLPFSTETSSSGIDQRQPVLEISAWNNVGEFVYPGDTVTFEITVKNTGAVPSYDTRLVQTLYNGVPEDFGVAEFDLGTIEPGKGGKLSFGLKLADDGLLPAGPYYTVAKAFGKAPNGNEVSSNEARTDFEIRWKQVSSVLEAKAVAKEEEILGSLTAQCPEPKEDILPYVLLLLLSSAYLINWAKPKLQKGEK